MIKPKLIQTKIAYLSNKQEAAETTDKEKEKKANQRQKTKKIRRTGKAKKQEKEEKYQIVWEEKMQKKKIKTNAQINCKFLS